MKNAASVWAGASILIVLLLVAVAASVLLGKETLSIGTALTEWREGLPLSEAPTLSIYVEHRVPRTLAALLAGAGLAIAGCAFQALLRNPLATPFTLGVANASAFGAFTATVLGSSAIGSFSVLGFTSSQVFSPQVFAFLFAGLDVLIIYAVASQRARISPSVLLLTGVTLGMLANSGILFLRYLARPEQVVAMDRWLMGGVDVLGFDPLPMAVGGVPCMLFLVAQAGRFDQIGFGDELAEARGLNVGRLYRMTFLVGSFLTAVLVSVVGPIGFVGLIVPHAVRSFTGSRHRILMPLSAVAGGAFLCFCDIFARQLMTGEMPIGIITSLLGGPFFIYLLLRRRITDWGG